MLEKQGSSDVYRFYKTNTSKPVDYTTFTRVWKNFITQVIRNIVFTGKDFNMPSLGALGIRKQKIQVKITPDGNIDTRYLAPDWKATKELWKRNEEAKKNKQRVFHLNKHFNGYKCRWFWDKAACSVPNNTAYSFIMTRANKRFLAGVLQDEDNEVDYSEQRPKPEYDGRRN